MNNNKKDYMIAKILRDCIELKNCKTHFYLKYIRNKDQQEFY